MRKNKQKQSKSNLNKINLKNNISREFYVEIFDKLKKLYKKVKIIKPVKKLNSNDDIYYKYYGNLIFKPGERKKHKTVFYSSIK